VEEEPGTTEFWMQGIKPIDPNLEIKDRVTGMTIAKFTIGEVLKLRGVAFKITAVTSDSMTFAPMAFQRRDLQSKVKRRMKKVLGRMRKNGKDKDSKKEDQVLVGEDP
jgi:hypothetical protein